MPRTSRPAVSILLYFMLSPPFVFDPAAVVFLPVGKNGHKIILFIVFFFASISFRNFLVTKSKIGFAMAVTAHLSVFALIAFVVLVGQQVAAGGFVGHRPPFPLPDNAGLLFLPQDTGSGPYPLPPAAR